MNHPIGITIPHRDILPTTVHQLVEFDELINIMIVNGLDGSGYHKLYNQLQEQPDISTKTFPFDFRIISIKDMANEVIWKNPAPNSPFVVH